MKPTTAGIFAIAAILYLLMVLPAGLQGFVAGDPGKVLLKEGAYAGSVLPETRLYLKSFGITIYESRIKMPGDQQVAEIPLPRLGDTQAVSAELKRLEVASQ